MKNYNRPSRPTIALVTASILGGSVLGQELVKQDDNPRPLRDIPAKTQEHPSDGIVPLYKNPIEDRSQIFSSVRSVGDNPFTKKPNDQLRPVCVSGKAGFVEVDAYVKGLGRPLRGFVELSAVPDLQTEHVTICDGSQGRGDDVATYEDFEPAA